MNRRTTTVLAIIVVILIAVFAITRWQHNLATRKLLADLPGDDYAKVLDAMTQLKERGHSITPALLDSEHLTSPLAPARWRSATLLGDVGTRAAWEPLKQALGDDSAEVRAAAALALGKLGATDAQAELQARVTDAEEDPAVRVNAALALGLLGDQASSATLQTIAADTLLAIEGEAWKAYSALKAAKEAIPKAQEAIEPAQTALAEAQAKGEGIKEAQAALDAAIAAVPTAEAAVEPAEKALKEARDKCMAAGGRAPEQFDIPVVEGAPPPADAPKPPADNTADLRAACLRALGMIGAAESVSVAAGALDVNKEPNAEVRTAAAYAMGDLAKRVAGEQASGVLDGLIQAQEDTVGDVRAAALHSMASLRANGDLKTRAAEVLEKGLSDDFYWAREAARGSMRRLGIPVPAK